MKDLDKQSKLELRDHAYTRMRLRETRSSETTQAAHMSCVFHMRTLFCPSFAATLQIASPIFRTCSEVN